MDHGPLLFSIRVQQPQLKLEFSSNGKYYSNWNENVLRSLMTVSKNSNVFKVVNN